MNTNDKILVVDDNSDVRYVVSMILKKGGYSTVEAANGRECLQKIKETDPILVILDIMMPDMDGWEVCKAIKETTPDLPISILSACGSEDDIKRSLAAGADRHLTKPIVRDEILSTVHDLLKDFKHNS